LVLLVVSLAGVLYLKLTGLRAHDLDVLALATAAVSPLLALIGAAVGGLFEQPEHDDTASDAE
jgi:hypothetical protein